MAGGLQRGNGAERHRTAPPPFIVARRALFCVNAVARGVAELWRLLMTIEAGQPQASWRGQRKRRAHAAAALNMKEMVL